MSEPKYLPAFLPSFLPSGGRRRLDHGAEGEEGEREERAPGAQVQRQGRRRADDLRGRRLQAVLHQAVEELME